MTHIIRLEPQPRFPVEDLTPDNTAVIKHLINNEAGMEVRAKALTTEQLHLLEVCHMALRFGNYSGMSSTATQAALTRGFVGFETIAQMVRPPAIYDEKTAAAQANRVLLGDDFFASMTMLDEFNKFQYWHPMTHAVIQEMGERYASNDEVNSITMGAIAARQLMLPAEQ